MAFNPTKSQIDAINTNGNVLVSAAAGSGKTAVLVERVIKMLTRKENPISVDRLLIVTFTNAAAAELRARIEKRIYEECIKNPNDIGLKKQKYLISSAKICTIDSFCIDLVRENFEKLGINPDFKVSDEKSINTISGKIISDIINKLFEENNSDFYRLLELIGCEFDELKLIEAIKNLYTESMITPFPASFLDNLVSSYSEAFDKNNFLYKKSFENANLYILKIKEQIQNGLTLSESLYDDEPKYIDFFETISKSVDELEIALKTDVWNNLFIALHSFSLPSLPSSKKVSNRPEVNSIKYIKEKIGKYINVLNKTFYVTSDEISEQNKYLYPSVKLLIDMVKDYSDKMLKAQIEENAFTFSTIEQLTLSMMCKETDGQILLTEDADTFFNRFDEILVDEYQDVNDLQDMIFYAVSNKESKLFAVGDVKQSIYGFRGANPNNFLRKKEKYIPLHNAKDNDPKKIVLSNNFRSRKEICSFINYLFKNLMTKETGEINYDSEEELIATADYPDINTPINELYLVDNMIKEHYIVTADAIAKNIRRIMDSEECIRTKDGSLRKAKLSDFAILLRSASTSAPIIASELERQGISVNYQAESFVDCLEISVFLSLLQVIDNPADDIALLTVMMSPIFSFTADEMATIRANYQWGDLISAVTFSKQFNTHIAEFLNSIEEYRRMTATTPLGSLIHKLISLCGYGDIVNSMKDGERRYANLLRLAELATDYCNNTGDGIKGFVKYLKGSAASKLTSAKTGSFDDSVKLMNIHTSKGLQFPICILANIEVPFNLKDTSKAMVYSSKNGLGFTYYNEELKKKENTLSKPLIAEDIKFKTYEEELRLLYVALTRAEDRLLIIGCYKNLQKDLGKLYSSITSSGDYISNDVFSNCSSFSDWILSAFLLHPDGDILRKYIDVDLSTQSTESHFNIHITDAEYVKHNVEKDETNAEFIENNTLIDKINQNINFVYPYDELRTIEAKASVSDIANKAEDFKYSFNTLPSFMEKSGLGAAAKGTAMHKIMQFFSFDNYLNPKDEIERLVEWEYISETEAEAIDISLISEFFKSNIFKRIKKSAEIHREMRFLTEISAKKFNPTLSDALADEKIIVQGAVDLCFVESDGIVLLDFKSDRVKEEQSLIKAYSEQLNIYSEACAKIFNKPVKEKIIYSFSLKKEIQI